MTDNGHIMTQLLNTFYSSVHEINQSVHLYCTLTLILHFPFFSCCFYSVESSRRIYCEQCSSLSKLLFHFPYYFYCLLYIIHMNLSFISLSYIFAEHL